MVMPKWENAGSTPTQDMRTHVSWKWFPGEPPSNYSYPDLDEKGDEVTLPEIRPAFVGPKGNTYAATLNIPIFWLDKVRAGRGRIFIWGWGEYNDVFKGTTLHRTEFCIELTVLNLGTAETKPQIVQAVIYFPLYGLFNSPS
jgi:hypothetical protein